MSDCLWPHGLYSTRLLCPWDTPNKTTGVGCLPFPPQGDFPNLGIELKSLMSPAFAGGLLNTSTAWKWSRSIVSNSLDPMDCSLSDSSSHGIFQARVLERIAISFSRGSSDPGIAPGSPALQADALPSEPPGKHHLGSPQIVNYRHNVQKITRI